MFLYSFPVDEDSFNEVVIYDTMKRLKKKTYIIVPLAVNTASIMLDNIYSM